jgi:hypothetical protein
MSKVPPPVRYQRPFACSHKTVGGLLESVRLLESCRCGKGNTMAVKKKPTAKKKPVARNKPDFSRVQSGYRQGREERQKREEQEKKR